jgi:regulator of sigma E protease
MAGSLLHTVFFFIVALAILIAFHEYGHFWAARRLGVKVLRFSLGFGKTLWRHQKSPADTEFVVAALPLGGYVKMVDEREGEVAPADLPYAFNRQPLMSRVAIVAAGPIFNFILAILIYWAVFMMGETGIRPVLGPVAQGTLAAQAGFREGDEIVAVGDDETPTWSIAIGEVVERAMDEQPIIVRVKAADGDSRLLTLNIPKEASQDPEALYKNLGFRPFEPEIAPVVERLEPGSAAEAAGIQPGDRIVSADGTKMDSWRQWVEYVRARPETPIRVVLDRSGVNIDAEVRPRAVDSPEGKIGRIGATVRIPEAMADGMRVTYRLGPWPALAAAVEKTTEYSAMTLKMVGRMLVGRAAVENLSGPISIAQYAGQSASMGLGQFLKFLAIVSISLGVLNLLPIPVLDGGHLMFYLVEGIKGSPVSERTQARCQQIGIFILLSLMSLAFVLDLERLFS